MHITLLVLTLGMAIAIRAHWQPRLEDFGTHWRSTLTAFLIPPLVMAMMAIAILVMGHQGTMFSHSVGQLGCALSQGFLGIAGLSLLYRAVWGWRSRQHIRTLPWVDLGTPITLPPVILPPITLPISSPMALTLPSRLLACPIPFAGQVGFWQPELVVSEGLLQTLSSEQLQAVFAHEQAHHHYRDTFWFFWLGWLRSLTAWLPKTEALWQELLLLRELRADRQAAHTVDPLVLAEALLEVARWHGAAATLPAAFKAAVAFDDVTLHHRLEIRITQLLEGSPEPQPTAALTFIRSYGWICLWMVLPILSISFHR